MIRIRRSDERGHANHGWLDAYHTFSFADYQDPAWVHQGPLRVINQDRIAPAKGFQTHGHENMEIITYVLEGAVEHKDSMGNGSVIHAGEVQVMSAGSGVTHSEFNHMQDATTELLQMWIFPRSKGTPPRYGQRAFPLEERRDQLALAVGPDEGDAPLQIDQDARFFVSELTAGKAVNHEFGAGRLGWLHVAKGSVKVNGETLGPGDGAGFEDEGAIEIEGVDDAKLVLFDLPRGLSH